MDERSMQFKLGVFTLAAIFITGILVVIFGDWSAVFRSDTYTLFISFPEAPGIARDTPVRRNGILIGRVVDVEFVDVEDAGVLVSIEVQRSYNGKPLVLRRNEVCQIKGGLLGDTVLQFAPSGDKSLPRDAIEDGDVLRGVVLSDPLTVVSNLEGSIGEMIRSVSNTSDQLGLLAQRVNNVLDANDEQFTRIVSKLEETVTDIDTTVDTFNDIIGDPQLKSDLKAALSELPETVTAARRTIEKFNTTLVSAEENLKNLQGLTGPLGKRGATLVANIEEATGKFNDVLEELSYFSEAINDPNGSVGKLLNNPELYDELRETVSNIKTITREVRPILGDVREFSDKIARHPEQLGVRGALNRSSGIKARSFRNKVVEDE